MFRHLATLALLTLLLASAPAGARANSRSPEQIHAAVARAERSRALWATVNVCNAGGRYRDVIGVRAQMPALGFSAALSMVVVVDYWNAGKLTPVPRAKRQVRIGNAITGTRQGGVNFQFRPPAGRLTGQVTFEWRMGGKLLGTVTRSTTAGHPDAKHGHPTHHSAATCTIS